MLVKVEYGGVKKFIKVPDIEGTFDLPAFFQEVTDKFSLHEQLERRGELCLTDETGTEVDADIFDELLKSGVKEFRVNCQYSVTDLHIDIVNDSCDSSVVQLSQPATPSSSQHSPTSPAPSLLESLSSPSSNGSDSVIMVSTTKKKKAAHAEMDRVDALQKVESVLKSHPKGKDIFTEYEKTKKLSDGTRRLMVNILVAEMTESYGRLPPRCVRTSYARGIVALFPYLEDPFSKMDLYEHFYDPAGNTGYLAWRLKTVQRNSSETRQKSPTTQLLSSPIAQRQSLLSVEQLDGEECQEAISVITHSTDDSLIKAKMKETFQYRQKLVHDQNESSSIFEIFPRFLDTPGLIEQDFSLMFGESVSGKFISKWPTYFKPKVIDECKKNPNVSELLSSLDSGTENEHGWDSDVTSLLLLLQLLPPTSRGPKKMAKISSAQATDRLFKFLKEGRSLSTFLEQVNVRQPFLLCIGEHKKKIEKFFIVMDKVVLPCAAQTGLAAFDTLFKAHYVFSVSYDEALESFYTFIQTTVYNIDVGQTKETPRVKELRTRLLQE
ncbi:hypothetical protein WMY93_002316 [Mugilogobius chulae]|uniref:PB1 domain-containing protein n=1 Tax=Mugilogobius chulae TaxID=88201 RepID=A0AAW0Q1R6_9GOBI